MKRVQSFEDARRRKSRILRALKYVALVFVAYEAFSAFAFKSWAVASSSMQPTLARGDRVVVASSAYGILNPLTGKRTTVKAPKRGDLVMVRLPSAADHRWHERLLDSMIRFLTAQRLGLPVMRSAFESPVIKRVVATPGDSVKMENFIVYVKAEGTSHYLTEYEVSGADYNIGSVKPVQGWGQDMPLAGMMDPVELGDGEFFVVGDNRFSSSDSRFFGPVEAKHFIGAVILRYWPLDRISGL